MEGPHEEQRPKSDCGLGRQHAVWRLRPSAHSFLRMLEGFSYEGEPLRVMATSGLCVLKVAFLLIFQMFCVE